MKSLTATLIAPFIIKNSRKRKPTRSSLLDHPPPPVVTSTEWKFGPYSWKVVVEALDDKGEMYRSFVGYSQNMNITDRTRMRVIDIRNLVRHVVNPSLP